MPAPPFGTASAYADSFPAPPPRQVTVSAETCYNLSVFRDIVKQYRQFDDQIITRLNRASAQLRDQERTSSAGSSSSRSRWWSRSADDDGIEAMCAKMWGEMMSGWLHRQTLLTYCLQTVTTSLEAKRPQEDDLLSLATVDRKRIRGIKEEEVLQNQLANEESVEAIIRKRSLDAFKSRCPFFSPPPGNKASTGWWELADSGRAGKGPDIP